MFSCEFYEIFKNTFFYSGGCFCLLPKDKMTLEIRREFLSKIVFMKMKIKQIWKRNKTSHLKGLFFNYYFSQMFAPNNEQYTAWKGSIVRVFLVPI